MTAINCDCNDCGAQDQPCCDTSPANENKDQCEQDLKCIDHYCKKPPSPQCGAQHQPCCDNSSATENEEQCNQDLKCIDGHCTSKPEPPGPSKPGMSKTSSVALIIAVCVALLILLYIISN